MGYEGGGAFFGGGACLSLRVNIISVIEDGWLVLPILIDQVGGVEVMSGLFMRPLPAGVEMRLFAKGWGGGAGRPKGRGGAML